MHLFRFFSVLAIVFTVSVSLGDDRYDLLEKELDAIYGEIKKEEPAKTKRKKPTAKARKKRRQNRPNEHQKIRQISSQKKPSSMERLVNETPKKPSAGKKTKSSKNSKSSSLSDNLKFIMQLEARVKKNPTNLAFKEKLAGYYLAEKRANEAIKLLKQDSDRLSRNGLNTLANAYKQTKRLKELVQLLTIYVNAGTADAEVYTMLGEAHRKLENHTGAVATFKAAIQLKVSHMPAWLGLIQTFKDTKNTYELSIVFNDMIKKLGPKDIAYNELCRLNTENGFIEKAKGFCQEAIQRNPKVPENHIYLGMTMIDSGNIKQGTRIIKQTAKQFPNSELAQWKAGDLSESEANYAGAARYYQQATRADGKSARGYLGLARSKFELLDYDMAYSAFFKACRLDKTKTQNFKTAGKRLRNQGNLSLHKKYKTGLGQCLLKKPRIKVPDVKSEPVWEDIN